MGFAQKLKEVRKQKGLSQIELAKKVGLHYTQLGRYEKGKSVPTSDTLLKLAEALETSTDYLVENKIRNITSKQIFDPELLEQFKKVEKLSEEDKKVIKILIDAFLTKRKIQEIVG